ncbi:hypothetical protein IW262DRAFT_1296020 [Armillaria fumosa]|nr:hypothetical protein IW262DRAFT_1296020 [Armillaria fumosa]
MSLTLLILRMMQALKIQVKVYVFDQSLGQKYALSDENYWVEIQWGKHIVMKARCLLDRINDYDISDWLSQLNWTIKPHCSHFSSSSAKLSLLPYQTGFGHEEEEYLAKNAIDFHLLESGEFSALSKIWLETIWQQQVLYWLPKDHTDNGLRQHHKHVHYALRWLFNALDPDTCKQQLAYATTYELKVHPPGLLEIQHSMVQPLPVPPIDIFKPPTPEQIAKSKAVHAAKYAVRVRLCHWKEDEACRARWLARSQHIWMLHKLHQKHT